jgi:hypothetical protein
MVGEPRTPRVRLGGWWRLWVIFTIAWLIYTAFDVCSMREKSLNGMLWAASDSELVWCGSENYPSGESFISKTNSELNEIATQDSLSGVHAQSCLRARADAVVRRAEAHSLHEGDKGWYLMIFAIWGAFPPLVLLGLGFLVRWVARGFGTK